MESDSASNQPSKKRAAPAKKWCFTDFDVDRDWIALAASKPDIFRYICVGQEVCPTTGRPHQQGWFQLLKKKRVSGLRTLAGLKRGEKAAADLHFEKVNGSNEQNDTYCQKGGDFKTWGTSQAQGHRSDLDDVIKKIEEGKPMREVAKGAPKLFIQYHNGMRKYKELRDQEERKAFRQVETTLLTGPTGCGKTRAAMESDDDIFKIQGGQLRWWDGYAGEKTILIDEYNNDLKITDLLCLLDGYRLRLEVKGTFTYANWTKVWITTNLKTLHENAKPAHQDALARRITETVSYWPEEQDHFQEDLFMALDKRCTVTLPQEDLNQGGDLNFRSQMRQMMEEEEQQILREDEADRQTERKEEINRGFIYPSQTNLMNAAFASEEDDDTDIEEEEPLTPTASPITQPEEKATQEESFVMPGPPSPKCGLCAAGLFRLCQACPLLDITEDLERERMLNYFAKLSPVGTELLVLTEDENEPDDAISLAEESLSQEEEPNESDIDFIVYSQDPPDYESDSDCDWEHESKMDVEPKRVTVGKALSTSPRRMPKKRLTLSVASVAPSPEPVRSPTPPTPPAPPMEAIAIQFSRRIMTPPPPPQAPRIGDNSSQTWPIYSKHQIKEANEGAKWLHLNDEQIALEEDLFMEMYY